MDMEELEPRKVRDFEIGGDLSSLSIKDLKELAEKLKKEISRIEEEIRTKESTRNAADSVFKS